MHVVATAGHVDHGKSTVVRQLTGMEPDRWAEERRRGMTLDLGFAWTVLPTGQTVAVVDVPGHERFVPTMLAGVGPVPAVLFVIAADEGWMPQSTEHLDALNALGVEHGLLIVTRCDLAEPDEALDQADKNLHGTTLAGLPSVCVSGRTGQGIAELRDALGELVADLPTSDPDGDRRFWIDRAFQVRGAGTVVTGTLRAGTVRVGDELQLHRSGRTVGVRGVQSLGQATTQVSGVARVALNLRGVPVDELRRGDALVDPGRWWSATVIDVRLHDIAARELPNQLMLHVGSATMPVRVRPLGGVFARLSPRAALPLRVGDRALLRDPGAHRIAAGLVVLDVHPPELTRRGAAARRARELAERDVAVDGAAELRRRRVIRADDLRAMGLPPGDGAVREGDWVMDPAYRDELAERLVRLLDDHHRDRPLDGGMPAEATRRALGLPAAELLRPLLRAPCAQRITLRGGRLAAAAARFPEPVRRGLDALLADLHARPFDAPSAGRLSALGLGERELAAAEDAGELLRLAPGLVLLPDADTAAAQQLAALPETFTVSQARQCLETSRRVAVPLLELLAHRGFTERLADGRHRLSR